jgi:Papain family cysteine protease
MEALKKGFTRAIGVAIAMAIVVTIVGPAPAHASAHSKAPVDPGKHGLGLVLPTVKASASRMMKTSALSDAAAAAIPASADLSGHDVPVGYQGSLGSCTTWAIDYGMLGWYSNYLNKPGQPFNPMYTYAQIVQGRNIGTSAAQVLNIAMNQGNDTAADYSHDYFDYTDQPNASEIANASHYEITGWKSLWTYTGGGGGTTGAQLIEQALANNQPVAIGMQTRAGFDNMAHTDIADTDYLSTPTSADGNHEVLAVGYNANGLLIQNSWGTNWGFRPAGLPASQTGKGYGRLSWAVVEHDVYQGHTISGVNFTGGNQGGNTTSPTMGAVTQRFALNQQVSNSTEPVNFKWSASGANGISGYAVYVSANGGQWSQDTSLSTTATQVTYALTIGSSYQVAVAAQDGAGNWSQYAFSTVVKPGVTDDTAFTVSTPWTRYTLTDSYGGTYIAASQAGAWITETFTGHDSALVGPTFSNAGRATFYCDGTSGGLVDEYHASTVGRQVLAWCHFGTGGQHTMKIVVEGTSGRPWFGVDAFAYLP